MGDWSSWTLPSLVWLLEAVLGCPRRRHRLTFFISCSHRLMLKLEIPMCLTFPLATRASIALQVGEGSSVRAWSMITFPFSSFGIFEILPFGSFPNATGQCMRYRSR